MFGRKNKAFTLSKVFIPHSNCCRKVAFILAEAFIPHPNCVDLPPHPSPLPAGARECLAAWLPSCLAAFTLAEVLITLGVIGVVAAITMPAVIKNHQKKVALTRLKEAYSILSQAMALAQTDYGEPKYWNYASGEVVGNAIQEATTVWVETYVLPYLQDAKVHGWKSLKKVGITKGYVNLKGELGSNWYNNPSIESYYTVELKNSQILFFGYNGNDDNGKSYFNGMLARVDVNGRKGPNMHGKDYFLFQYYNNKLVPFYPAATYKQAKENCKKDGGGGSLCAKLIMMDGWQMKEYYPW